MFGFLNLDGNADDSLQRRLKSVLTSYLMALQPWSFSISLAPVALGNVLSWRDQSQFSLPILVLSTIVVLSVHAAGNAVYAYRDRRGKPGNQSPNAMVRIGVLLYVLSCGAMLGVMCISPAKIEHLALLFFGGLSASFLYTGRKAFCLLFNSPHNLCLVLNNENSRGSGDPQKRNCDDN